MKTNPSPLTPHSSLKTPHTTCFETTEQFSVIDGYQQLENYEINPIHFIYLATPPKCPEETKSSQDRYQLVKD
jgi:hypothetical protein